MADAGCSGGRNRRHFADVQAHVLTSRFGASSSESRPSAVGQLRSSEWIENRRANDRSQSTADAHGRPLAKAKSLKRSLKELLRRLTSRARRTSVARVSKLALTTHCRPQIIRQCGRSTLDVDLTSVEPSFRLPAMPHRGRARAHLPGRAAAHRCAAPGRQSANMQGATKRNADLSGAAAHTRKEATN